MIKLLVNRYACALVVLLAATVSHGEGRPPYPTAEETLDKLFGCLDQPHSSPQCAELQPPNWTVVSQTDPITDETTVAILARPSGRDGLRNLNLSLAVMCLRGRVQMRLFGNFNLPRGGTRFVHRYDRGAPYHVPWSDLEQGGMTIHHQALRDLIDTRSLTIRLSTKEDRTITAQFETVGFREAGEHLRQYCPALPWD